MNAINDNRVRLTHQSLRYEEVVPTARQIRDAYLRNSDPVPDNAPRMSRATTWPVAMLAGAVCWVALFRVVGLI
jgi:hypothetical protein